MSRHLHTKTGELAVYFIPADEAKPMELMVIPDDYHSMIALVGGYIQEVPRAITPRLDCGCRVSIVVDEEGLLKGLPLNFRASIYSPHNPLVGDAFLVGSGFMTPANPEDDPEEDFFSLHQVFNTWEGPGHHYPVQKQPWEK